jgi:hypothetical protein
VHQRERCLKICRRSSGVSPVCGKHVLAVVAQCLLGFRPPYTNTARSRCWWPPLAPIARMARRVHTTNSLTVRRDGSTTSANPWCRDPEAPGVQSSEFIRAYNSKPTKLAL